MADKEMKFAQTLGPSIVEYNCLAQVSSQSNTLVLVQTQLWPGRNWPQLAWE
jgi:hypothetical protein